MMIVIPASRWLDLNQGVGERERTSAAFTGWPSRLGDPANAGRYNATTAAHFSSHAALTVTTMSTRSAVRTRQASRAETSNQASQEAASAAQDEKENMKVNGPSGRTRVTRKSSSKPYCICKKPDDGSPMIHCASCKDWYVALQSLLSICHPGSDIPPTGSIFGALS